MASAPTPEEFLNDTTQNATSPGITDATGDISDAVASQMLGSAEFAGLFVLGLFGFTLWKADVSTDVGAVVLIPTVFTLARYGWLPGGQGILTGAIFALAGIVSFGLIKYLQR